MSDPKKFQPNCKIVSMNELRITPDRQLQLPDADDLPVLPARNLVIFPGVTIPLTLVRESSRRAAAMAKEAGMLIGLSCQKDADLSAVTGADDLCEYGTLVEVLDIIELPDDSRAAVLRARQKYRVLGNSLKPHDDGILRVAVEPITEPAYRMTEQTAMLIGEIKSVAKEYDRRGGDIEPTFSLTLDSLGDQGVINYVSTAFPLTVEQKIRLLSVYRVPDRGKQLLGMLSSKMEQLALSNEFKERARQEMERGSREAFLREEMEAIRRDLYGDDDPAEKYRKQAAQLPLPEADAALWQSLEKNTEPAAGKTAEMLFPDRPGKRDDFYSELCSKRSRGLARVWTLEREGEIVCTVGAYALADGQAYMACGETAEALRGRGIGGRLIVGMANALSAEGWMPVFLCSPERVHFYTRLGFEKMGEYARYEVQ